MTKDVNTGRGKEFQPNDAIYHSWSPGSPLQGACQAGGLMGHQGVPRAQGQGWTELSFSFLNPIWSLASELSSLTLFQYTCPW